MWPTFIEYLNEQTHVDSKHDHHVEQGEQLGEGQLELGVSVVAGEHEQEDGHEVEAERQEPGEAEHSLTGAGDHHEDASGADECPEHDAHLNIEAIFKSVIKNVLFYST